MVEGESELESIHRDLLAGEPTASRALVHACSAALFATLRPLFPVLHREHVEDGVHDALLALIARPGLYDPACGTLWALLVSIGKNKLIDQCRRMRRCPETAVGGDVELDDLETNHDSEPAYAGDRLWEVEALVAKILPDAADRAVFQLVCEGRTSVDEFAAILGLEHLSTKEKRDQVKRCRDRVVRKIRYHREEFRMYLL